MQLQREETVLPHEWDDPTEEEREEDIREDEQCARREAEAAMQFVQPAMIVRPFQRPRPVVVCLSRDVPATAKKNIVQRFEHDLPGLAIHIDDDRKMGLQVNELQQALSNRYMMHKGLLIRLFQKRRASHVEYPRRTTVGSRLWLLLTCLLLFEAKRVLPFRCNPSQNMALGRFSVICNVDIGIGERQRRAFLQRLATVKEALIPTPNFVMVIGDGKNRSGGALNASVGCSDRDLSVMGDGGMKRRLEDVARIVEELRSPDSLEAMANMGACTAPPSSAHVLVMEALIILLTPQKQFPPPKPFSSLRCVTWTEARHILKMPDTLWAAVARVDACNIPPANVSALQASVLRCALDTTRTMVASASVDVSVLKRFAPRSWITPQAYIGHSDWPGKGTAPIGECVLGRLAAWAYYTIEFSVLLDNAGGCPSDLCHYSTSSPGLLAAVVPVHDSFFGTQMDRGVDFKRG